MLSHFVRPAIHTYQGGQWEKCNKKESSAHKQTVKTAHNRLVWGEDLRGQSTLQIFTCTIKFKIASTQAGRHVEALLG